MVNFHLLPAFAASLTFFVCLSYLYLSGFDVIVDRVILSRLAVTPDGPSTKFWLRPPVVPVLRVYFYNFTNVQEFASGLTDTPLFTEVGPFVYKQRWQKVNVSWDEELDTVTYSTRKVYTFDLSESVADQSDVLITTLNVPLVTAMHQMRKADMFTVFGLNMVIDSLQYNIWTEKTVEELVWGYEEPLFKLAGSVSSQAPKFDKFGFFHQANLSQDLPSYTMKSGRQRPDLLSDLVSFNGQSSFNFWKSDECNRIHGSDGALFRPHVDKNDTLWLFNDQLCRALPLVYNSSVRWPAEVDSLASGSAGDHIEVHKYLPRSDVFGELIAVNSEDGHCDANSESCFCTNPTMCNFVARQSCTSATDNHLHLFDVSRCQFGAPIMLSFPHFGPAQMDPIKSQTQRAPSASQPMTVDQLRQSVDGSKHQFYFYVDPLTGTSVSAKARLQINVAVIPNDKFAKMSQILKEQVVPILWFEDGIDSIADSPDGGVSDKDLSLGQLIMSATLQPAMVKTHLAYSVIGVAILSALLMILLIWTHVHSSCGHSPDSSLRSSETTSDEEDHFLSSSLICGDHHSIHTCHPLVGGHHHAPLANKKKTKVAASKLGSIVLFGDCGGQTVKDNACAITKVVVNNSDETISLINLPGSRTVAHPHVGATSNHSRNDSSDSSGSGSSSSSSNSNTSSNSNSSSGCSATSVTLKSEMTTVMSD